MKSLSSEELLEVTGGGIKMGIFLGILSFGVLIVGIIDGFLRPYGCRK